MLFEQFLCKCYLYFNNISALYHLRAWHWTCDMSVPGPMMIQHTICLHHLTSMRKSLQWRHNGCNIVSNHQPHDCFLNRVFNRRSKKTSHLRVTGLCAGNSPATGVFPAQMARNAEDVTIWWRHHDYLELLSKLLGPGINQELLSAVTLKCAWSSCPDM